MQALGIPLSFVHHTTGYLLDQLAAKDRVTVVHSVHVALVASRLAREMGLKTEAKWVYEAGLLHDIGKLYISEELLVTRKVFSPQERQAMQLHVTYTQGILKGYNYPHQLIEACYQHHERLNGSGYPLGLKGDQISVGGRILAVADVFTALVTPRPYRNALSVKQAIEIMLQETNSGRLAVEVVSCLVGRASEYADLCRQI